MAVFIIVVWGLTALVCAVVAGIVAAMKRRDHSFWAAWTFLFPPMLLILLLMSTNTGPIPRRRGIDDERDYNEA
ncbi:MAG: hypothetical protein AB7K67_07100 [Hyphomicrobiaceae bacterium]